MPISKIHLQDAVIWIMATIAKQENIRRSKRIVAGLQHAKRNGSRLGHRSATPTVEHDSVAPAQPCGMMR